MNKFIIIFFYAFILGGAFAYSSPLKYSVSATAVKFYNDKINKTSCMEMMKTIPLNYYANVNAIKVFARGKVHILGQYWWGATNIEIFGGCDQETLIHELAHHCQYMRKDKLWQGYQHAGNFSDCLEEIKSSRGILYDAQAVDACLKVFTEKEFTWAA